MFRQTVSSKDFFSSVSGTSPRSIAVWATETSPTTIIPRSARYTSDKNVIKTEPFGTRWEHTQFALRRRSS